jgi:hypothetical protein
MQAELQQSLRDVSKAKKSYKELEGIASAARRSYAEAQDRSAIDHVLFLG